MTRRAATYPLVAVAAIAVAAAGRLTDVSPTARYGLASGMLLLSVAGALVWSERLIARPSSHAWLGRRRPTAGGRFSSSTLNGRPGLFGATVALVTVWVLLPIGLTTQVAVTVFCVLVASAVVVYLWLRQAAERRAHRNDEAPSTHQGS